MGWFSCWIALAASLAYLYLSAIGGASANLLEAALLNPSFPGRPKRDTLG
jgi:hypothetical protein